VKPGHWPETLIKRRERASVRYALAGEYAGAVRMHLARAARAPTRLGELGALRDALRWAGDEPALRRQASAALGKALWEAVRAEGIATERDRTRVREAADLLVAGDNHALAAHFCFVNQPVEIVWGYGGHLR